MHIDHFKEHFQTIIDQRQGAKVTYCLFEGKCSPSPIDRKSVTLST
ncbi:hypothetical protein AB6C70_25195 [Vibrio splendidus]|nr:hypothetical protein [Vibrio splendidus]